jgi:hypothetical protein
MYNIGNRLFAECSALCRVLFVGHLAKQSLSSVALEEITLSATTMFTERETLGIDRHSAKQSMPSATRSAKLNSRQRAVSSRLLADER